jgi:anaerobic selenocysteine-containing dehydrogenase
LAEEIETPGRGQIRALTTICGNPVLALANGKRLEQALSGLSFMASVDIYLNETTRHAHVILPTTFGLERDDYPLLSSAMAVRNRARYARAVMAPSPGALHDWQVLNELAARVLGERAPRGAGAVLRHILGRLNPRHGLDLMVRFGPYRKRGLSLSSLGDHGVDLGALEPRLPDVLATPDQRICLAPDVLVRDVSRLESELTEARGVVPALRLLGRRQLRSNNSWMHNAPRLMGGRERCTLLVHPLDAARLGLVAGGQARITSRVGSIAAPVEVSDEVMPGVVSLPHGWGHDRRGIRLAVAEKTPGVSLNDVTDDSLFDPLSGVTHLNGVPVQITPLGAE